MFKRYESIGDLVHPDVVRDDDQRMPLDVQLMKNV